jgi:hypothetical protein
MADAKEPHYVDRNGVEYFTRKITRLVRPWLHVQGHHGSNLRGDVEEMLQEAEGILEERDIRILTHIAKCCVRLDDTQPDGLIVSMNQKQYSRFIGIRRRFIEEKRNRLWDGPVNFKPKPIKIETNNQ